MTSSDDERMAGEGAADEQSTVARPRFDPSIGPQFAIVLVATEGPDAGLRYKLDGSQPSRVLVGQSPACELRLDDRAVSRRHAALEPTEDPFYRITDLGSTNGTFVDGVRIVEAYLRGGETVRLGSTAFAVEQGRVESSLALPAATSFGRIIGASTEMRRLYPLCARLAAADIPTIIEGETGTGKEVLAESLHEQGPRAAEPFVVFDCTAVAPSLLESELFGHVRGAFTGAVASRKGVFERAHGGTLLIDEIGDLQPSLQPKLLRVLERGEVRPVGGDRAIPVDVRVLAATRRDLDNEVHHGRFRDDLFHRLAVGRIELPPLRRRRGDVTVLARHFCLAIGGDRDSLPGDLLLRWEDYPWPGNVRELRNAVARHLALGDVAAALPRSSQPPHGGPPSEAQGGGFIDAVVKSGASWVQARQRVVRELERRYVEHLLEQHGGNVARAAAASGIARRYFQVLRARHR